jgi:hypothetical protein
MDGMWDMRGGRSWHLISRVATRVSGEKVTWRRLPFDFWPLRWPYISPWSCPSHSQLQCWEIFNLGFPDHRSLAASQKVPLGDVNDHLSWFLFLTSFRGNGGILPQGTKETCIWLLYPAQAETFYYVCSRASGRQQAFNSAEHQCVTHCVCHYIKYLR